MTETTGLWTRLGAGLLAVLWAMATVPLALDAAHIVRTHTTTRVLGAPTDAVIVQVQQERALSAGVVDRAALLAQRARTDEAYRRLQEARTGPMRRTTVGTDAARQADELLRRLADRNRLRTIVDGGTTDAAPVLTGYTRIVDAAFAGAPWLWPDRATGTGSALFAVGRAREALSEQSAVLLAAADPAKLDGPARARVTELALTRRVLLAEAAGQLPDAARSDYQALAADPSAGRLRALEDKLLLPDAPAAADPDWSATVDAYHGRLRAFEVAAVREAGQDPIPGAVATVAGAGLLLGVGLVAVLAMVRFLVRRTVTPVHRIPPAVTGSDSGLLEVVLEQNRRNQALMHRLLRLLDRVQRRVGDDGTLDALFRIDHLASRVRRNLEKTIALTGGTPGRRWTRPVPLMDVVRAAAAEVDGFERVSTAQVEPARLAGSSVIDVMHLLAELIENAVAFSPAETRVGITGRRDGDLYVLTVTDQGPGMPEDDLRIAAEVLASATPPATDAWHGLYAVGRLAERAALTVQLRNGDDGGLLAEVHLPAALLSGDDRPTASNLALAAVSGDE